MEPGAGQRLSPREYLSLIAEYNVRLHLLFTPPSPPVCYGEVRGKESGAVLAYLWHNAAREEWVMFSPDDATEEIVEAFWHE